MKKKVKKKKKYTKPTIIEEKIFERPALACGKCFTGPIQQFACRAVARFS